MDLVSRLLLPYPSDASFHHQPLDLSRRTFRLLHILPTLKNGLVQCEIEIKDFPDDAPEAVGIEGLTDHNGTRNNYNALSYEWGPQSPSYQILLNGKYFVVRENLSRFLHTAREQLATEADFRHFLWIDAICIDQNNIPERDHQVSHVGEIYTNASMVFIWLGLSTTEIDVASEEIHSIGIQVEAVDRSNGFYRHYTNDSEFLCRILDPDSTLLPAFLDICNRSYWGRMWITREVRLSANPLLIVGSHTFSWTLIRRALGHEKRSGKLQSCPAARLVDATGREPHDKEASMTLFKLAAQLGDGKCSDVRDRIYSILGILPSCPPKWFPVDYSITREELFFRVIAFDGYTYVGEKTPSIHDISYVDITRLALGISFKHLDGHPGGYGANLVIRDQPSYPNEKEYSFAFKADKYCDTHSIKQLSVTIFLQEKERQFKCSAICKTTAGAVRTYDSGILSFWVVHSFKRDNIWFTFLPFSIFLFLMTVVNAERAIQLQQK